MENKSNELTGNDPEVVASLRPDPSPEFKINKTELTGFLKGHLNPEYLVVFSFGLDESGKMVLFVDIKDQKGTVIKPAEMIQSGSTDLAKPINEAERKKSYIDSLGGLPGKRNGLCYWLTTGSKSHPGFYDFLVKHPGEQLYIYTGEGKIEGQTGIYRKLYFSFHDKISFAAEETLYNRGGVCCPPEPPPPPPPPPPGGDD